VFSIIMTLLQNAPQPCFKFIR